MTEKTPEIARLVYTGVRQTSKGPLNHCWLIAESNKELLFDKVKGSGIGSIYEVKVVREDGAIRSAYVNPTFTTERHDDIAQIKAWYALDLAARNADRVRKLEARYKKPSELDDALYPLHPIMKRARTYDEAEAIADIVRRRLLRAWHGGF